MWTFISAATVPHGLPALHSLFVKGEPTTLRVRIVQVGGEINRRRCDSISRRTSPCDRTSQRSGRQP